MKNEYDIINKIKPTLAQAMAAALNKHEVCSWQILATVKIDNKYKEFNVTVPLALDKHGKQSKLSKLIEKQLDKLFK
jgi:hypothetical protein